MSTEGQEPIATKLLSIQDYVSDEYAAPFTLAVAGCAGIGKTTLALSLAEIMPVYFLETENRFAYLAKKMKISLLDMPFPIKAITVNSWPEIISALGAIKTDCAGNDPKNKGVIVIDSGTDFKNFADHEWRQTSKVFPVTNWSKLYRMMNGVVAAIKRIGLSVVFTNRMKPKYEEDSWDGVTYEIDAFKNQEYLSEATLIIMPDTSIVIQDNKWHDFSLKNNDSLLLSRDMGLPEIIKLLQA